MRCRSPKRTSGISTAGESPPGGAAQATTSDKPTVEPLTEAEQHWLEAALEVLTALGAAPDDLSSISRTFDREVASFFATDQDHRADPSPIINALGVGIGAHLIELAGPTASWVIATDPCGTDLAVRQDGADVLVFPVNVLAKRWVAGEVGAIEALVAELARRMAALRSTD